MYLPFQKILEAYTHCVDLYQRGDSKLLAPATLKADVKCNPFDSLRSVILLLYEAFKIYRYGTLEYVQEELTKQWNYRYKL